MSKHHVRGRLGAVRCIENFAAVPGIVHSHVDKPIWFTAPVKS